MGGRMEPGPGNEAREQTGAAREPSALFVNTASRTGEESFDAAKECLTGLGLPLVLAQPIDAPERIPELVREALRSGVKRVLVGGGDGTLSAVAAELCGRDVRMGVLPLGTGNDFARSLRIPTSLAGACAVAAFGEVRRVDVGLANGRPFLNAASVGLSSAITERLTSELKRLLGRGAFTVAAVSEGWSHRPFQVVLESKLGTETLEVHQVVVGNGRYHGGGRLVAPGASPLAHRLEVYAIRSVQRPDGTADAAAGPEPDAHTRLHDRWTLLRVGLLLLRGRHLEHPAVVHRTLESLRLVADPVQEVDVDGELLGQTPVEFALQPGALQVLVPGSGSVAPGTFGTG